MEESKLLELAKRTCRITWEDDDTNSRILEIAENAEATLTRMLGIKEDEARAIFERPGQERMLFKNHCLYDWNDMMHEFEKNYISEIISVRQKYKVKYEKENQQL